MRALVSDLPLVLDDVSLQAGATVMLDRLSLVIAPGAPTLIIGPNGSARRHCCGSAWVSRGRPLAASAGAAGPTLHRRAARSCFSVR